MQGQSRLIPSSLDCIASFIIDLMTNYYCRAAAIATILSAYESANPSLYAENSAAIASISAAAVSAIDAGEVSPDQLSSIGQFGVSDPLSVFL